MKSFNDISGMEVSVIMTLAGIWTKFTAVVSSVWGWFLGVMGFILTYLLPIREMFIILGIIILTDMIVGLWCAIRNKNAITSSKLRGTIIKAAIYLVVLSLAFAIENQLGWDIASKVLFSIASAIELYSVIANILILYPNMPFLRLFKGMVEGEISKKTGVNKEKVEDFLKNKE